jgi:transposase InsO family protein
MASTRSAARNERNTERSVSAIGSDDSAGPGHSMDMPVTTVVSQAPQIDKLQGAENWASWKMLMEMILESDGLWGVVEREPAAEDLTAKDSEVYQRDRRARMKIALSLGKECLGYILEAKTAHQQWTKLCNNFEDKGVYRRTSLLKKIMFSPQGSRGLNQFVMDFRQLVNQYNQTGNPMDDNMSSTLLLGHLRPEYQHLAQILERTCIKEKSDGTSVMDYQRLCDELLREATKSASDNSKTALKVGSPVEWGAGGDSAGQSTSADRSQHQRTSGGSGSRRKQQQWRRPAAGRQQTGDSKDKWDGPYPPCPHCSGRGRPKTNHPAEACFFRPENIAAKRGDNRGRRSPKRLQQTAKPVGDAGKNKGPGPRVWALKMAKSHIPKNKNKTEGESVPDKNKNLEMYVDSGAFKTLCSTKDVLHNYKTVLSEPIECAGNEILHTQGIGALMLDHQKHNGLRKIDNVVYVPNLSSNLLSVSSVSKSGFVTVFKDNVCGVFDQKDVNIIGEPLLQAFERNGTYVVNLEVKEANHALKSSLSNDFWHLRFAHLGKNSLDALKMGLVDGISNQTLADDGQCENCLKSRQVRASFPRGEANRANDLLEIIHSDVCQVTDGPTWENYNYFVTFIDDKTRYTIIALLKTKDQVHEKFKEYKTLVEKQTGYDIKILRSDNGGEYISHEWAVYLKGEGILRQLSIPKTPEQNGVAERVNETLLNKVRAMLKQSGLSDRFWGEALKTAVYLKNLSPTKALKGMVPYHAWTGVKPNVEHLKVFGCSAYVHIPRDESKKLKDRSRECVFLGYDDEKKGYRLVDLKEPRVIFVERSVKFDETSFPALKLKPGKTFSRPGLEGERPQVPESITLPETKITTIIKSRQVPAVTDTDSESYTSTEISRVPGDEVSTSSGDTETPSSSIDVENSSIQSMEEISKRIRVPKQFNDYVVYGTSKIKDKNTAHLTVPTDKITPSSLQEALSCPESEFWIKAMKEELESFEENNVWSLEDLPSDAKVVGNKWVYKRKIKANGSVLHRARLVAKGYSQTYGVDYFETFAPVVRRTTLRVLFATAVNYDLKIDHIDVKTAFLHGDLSERVFMSQPEGFTTKGFEDKVCRLHKAVYGLKQAARSWNLKADKVLKDNGFSKVPEEPCVYIKRSDISIIIIALYVDDFYLIYSHTEDKISLLKLLESNFKIKDLGETQNCLGIKLVRDWKQGTLILQQEDYILSILSRFNMSDCKPSPTPMESKLNLKDYKEGERKAVPYQELIGCLLYLSINTRPDISYAVSFLSQYNSCYTTTHWKLAKRLVSYLKLTSGRGLKFTRSNNPTFCLVGYADASWAGNPCDYKSYSGFCFTLDGNLISWESKKQKLAAQSTTESEFISVTEAVKESIYLNDFINDLSNVGFQRITIFNDNQSTIRLANSVNFSARNKHMGCRMQLVRDCVIDGSVSVEYMPSNVMPADVLTKGLDKVKHEDCCKGLGMYMKNSPA